MEFNSNSEVGKENLEILESKMNNFAKYNNYYFESKEEMLVLDLLSQ